MRLVVAFCIGHWGVFVWEKRGQSTRFPSAEAVQCEIWARTRRSESQVPTLDSLRRLQFMHEYGGTAKKMRKTKKDLTSDKRYFTFCKM
jgi:hypothetical protein